MGARNPSWKRKELAMNRETIFGNVIWFIRYLYLGISWGSIHWPVPSSQRLNPCQGECDASCLITCTPPNSGRGKKSPFQRTRLTICTHSPVSLTIYFTSLG